MRPLFADFAADKTVWDMTDEFMFGHSILACPIVNPQYTEERIIRTNEMTGWNRQNATESGATGAVDFTATSSCRHRSIACRCSYVQVAYCPSDPRCST